MKKSTGLDNWTDTYHRSAEASTQLFAEISDGKVKKRKQ